MNDHTQMDWLVSAEEREIRQQKHARMMDYLRGEFSGYPFSDKKDPRYFEGLIKDFSELDIEEELKQYYAWVLDQDEGKKIYYRSRFRSWLKTAERFKQGRVFFRV